MTIKTKLSLQAIVVMTLLALLMPRAASAQSVRWQLDLGYELPNSPSLVSDAGKVETDGIARRGVADQSCAKGSPAVVLRPIDEQCRDQAEIAFRTAIAGIQGVEWWLYACDATRGPCTESSSVSKFFQLSAFEARAAALNHPFSQIQNGKVAAATGLFVAVSAADCKVVDKLGAAVSLGEDWTYLQSKICEAARGRPEFLAYKVFYDAAMTGDPARIAEAGEGFLAKFGTSIYAGGVYSRLASAYLNINQPEKMIAAGTKALQLNGDDVNVLPLMAWAIPRVTNSQTTDGRQQLQKALDYAKHGIDLLNSTPKPAEMDEASYAKVKNERLAMCHDGLGVIAAKIGKYPEAINELNQSVQLSATPDPVDYYLLAVSNQMTGHFTEAIANFTKCSLAGPLQTQCKAGLDDAKKKSQNSLAPK